MPIVVVALAGFLAFLAWAGTGLWPVALGLFLIVLIYGFFFAAARFRKHRLKLQLRHECFQLMNSGIIALSVHRNLSAALTTLVPMTAGPLKSTLETCLSLPQEEGLPRLSAYFRLPLFDLFVCLTEAFLDQGGNLLEASAFLLNEARRQEERLNGWELMAKRKVAAFAVLWAMTAAILLFARFGIGGFFQQMMHYPMFLLTMGIFLMIAMLSMHGMLMFVTRYPEAMDENTGN